MARNRLMSQYGCAFLCCVCECLYHVCVVARGFACLMFACLLILIVCSCVSEDLSCMCACASRVYVVVCVSLACSLCVWDLCVLIVICCVLVDVGVFNVVCLRSGVSV